MRIILILAAIGGVIWFAGSKLVEGGKKMFGKDTAGMAQTIAGTSSAPSSGSPVPALAPPQPAREQWREVEVVQFRNRAPLAVGKDFPGLQTVVDPDEWAVTILGNERWRVDALAAALRATDVPAEECTARIWAVFVTDSHVRGWDLAGALSAILNAADFEVEATAGNVKLRATADGIEAALRIICDGESVENVQSPHVILRHRTESKVSAETEIPVPTVTVSQGIATTGISYRNVGLETLIKSRFSGGAVVMEVSQTTGQLGAITNIGGNDVPSIERQTVRAVVELDVGQAVVLGGVDATRSRRAKGLFRDKLETVTGRWYVVIATTALVPRAVPVGAESSLEWFPPSEFPEGPPGVLPEK